jgi:dTDP-4-amino-4,6-dideoxygalactose transaminase
MSYKYPIIRPNVGIEELREIEQVFKSGWLTQGPYVERFERRITEYVKAKYAVAVSSCTAALYLSLKTFLRKGDKVIVPDFTFPATANAVIELGAKPVLVDVDYDCCLDLNELERTLRSHRDVKALILVHPFGHAVNVNLYKQTILDLNLDIPIIEDAATALGSIYNGEFAGNMGNVGCFSFHPRKLVTTGEGGMVVLNDDELYEKIRILRNHGRDKLGVFVNNSLNFKMSDIQAAMGLVQLNKLEKTIEERRRLAEVYHKLLRDVLPNFHPLREKSGCRSTYQSYIVRLPWEYGKHQNFIINRLKAYGIETQIGTYALHMEPAFKDCIVSSSLSMSERLRKITLTLPLYEGLEEGDIEYIVHSLETICKSLEV